MWFTTDPEHWEDPTHIQTLKEVQPVSLYRSTTLLYKRQATECRVCAA